MRTDSLWGQLLGSPSLVGSGPAKSVSLAREGSNPSPGATPEKVYIDRFSPTNIGENMSYFVKDYMDKEFPTLEIEASVVEAAKALAKQGKGYVIILERGKPYGIVTEWDLVSKVLATEKDPKKTPLRQITATPLVTIDPDEDMLKASELMQTKGIKRIPVVKSGVIYGVITANNIAQKCGEYVNKSVKDILRWSFPIV